MSDVNLAVGVADLAPSARIREAALRLYAVHGVPGTSIRMVAEAAEVSAGAVMHHFKSKEELAGAVQHAVVERIGNVVGAVGHDGPPHVVARERRRAFDQLISENPAIAGYLRHALLEGGPPGLALWSEAFELVRREMQAMVDAGVARPMPDPEAGLILYRALNLAHIVFAPLLEELTGVSLTDPESLERFREASVDLFTRPLFLDPDQPE